jgi:NADH-quinone oxidoreductase subunit M
MLLAGVVMKLGAYGCLRVAMTLFPEGLEDWGFGVMGFHSWRDVIAVLAVIGIVYGAMVALVQKDFKFVIGYSSVSHMGFVLLGLVTLNTIGLSGAVLQMFSHGVIAGLLFAIVGRMVYDRTHTRELSVLEGMNLSKAIPFAAATFVIAGVASMGLPGFSGFVAELQVLIGAWKSYPTLVVITGAGILIGVAYTLRAIQKAFFGENEKPLTPALTPSDGERETTSQDGHHHAMDAISIPERIGAVLLIGASLIIGLYPRLLLDVIVPSFNSPLFDGLRKVGLQ